MEPLHDPSSSSSFDAPLRSNQCGAPWRHSADTTARQPTTSDAPPAGRPLAQPGDACVPTAMSRTCRGRASAVASSSETAAPTERVTPTTELGWHTHSARERHGTACNQVSAGWNGSLRCATAVCSCTHHRRGDWGAGPNRESAQQRTAGHAPKPTGRRRCGVDAIGDDGSVVESQRVCRAQIRVTSAPRPRSRTSVGQVAGTTSGTHAPAPA